MRRRGRGTEMKLFPLRRELNNPPQNVVSKITLGHSGVWAGGEGLGWCDQHVLQEGKHTAAAATTVAELGAQLSLLSSSWQTNCLLDRSPRRTSSSPDWTLYWSKTHNVIICFVHIMCDDYHGGLVGIRHHTVILHLCPAWLHPATSSGFSLRLSQQLPLRVPSLTLVLTVKVAWARRGSDCVTNDQQVNKAHQVLWDRFPSAVRCLVPTPSSCTLTQLFLTNHWHCPNSLFWLQAVSYVHTGSSVCFSSNLIHCSQFLLIYQNHSTVTSSKKSFLITTLVESNGPTHNGLSSSSYRGTGDIYCPYL